MRDLVIVLILHIILRALGDSLVNAAVSTLLLVLMMMPCYYFGGWTSARSGLAWLIGHPRYGTLVLVGMAMSIVVGSSTGHNIALFSSELILVYFFFHGFFATLQSLVNWVRHRLMQR